MLKFALRLESPSLTRKRVALYTRLVLSLCPILRALMRHRFRRNRRQLRKLLLEVVVIESQSSAPLPVSFQARSIGENLYKS